ncbi:uncharacterized protein LOC113005762 [Solenopsis invicta]|uniref:uncharacterized protein LOC113005762 n=1 Tax=Solenopsis invicta TaxID=13686 RepID=UPI000E33E941|nr:uncharacterized protein LOC113005762 [Solenopsis invicta]
MADKIKLIIQKRTSLKSQLTNLSNILDKGSVDRSLIKLRMNRITELYHAFEGYNDELALLDPSEAHQSEFENVQERDYLIASKVENILHPPDTTETESNVSINGTRSDSTETIIKNRRIKLPEASLPTFDGKYENWLSFKNAFANMIGSRTDLSDIDKLHYLKSALIGDAASKIRIFAIDGINYTKAWELLERAYEVKRILISRHYSMILNLPAIDKESTSGLRKLAGDA